MTEKLDVSDPRLRTLFCIYKAIDALARDDGDATAAWLVEASAQSQISLGMAPTAREPDPDAEVVVITQSDGGVG